jgi:hypothetical protein
MRSYFIWVNKAAGIWNRFILIKNMTWIGLLLPWVEKMIIR